MPHLPNQWITLPFEECLDKRKIKFKKLKKKNIKSKGTYPVIDQGENFISGYVDSESDLYGGPLPVIIFGDHTRRIKFVDFQFAVGADGTKILNPLQEFHPKFFYYYLRALNLASQGYSRHYRFLKAIDVPKPSSNEQNRIVAKLERLLAKVEACKERLNKIPTLLKRFRQSVLAAACTGRLTADWREKHHYNRDDWPTVKFFDFCILQRGYDLPLSQSINGPYPIVTSAGVVAYHSKFKVQRPGVVTGRSGSIGKVHFVQEDFWPHNTTLFVKDFKGNEPKYVYYFLLYFDTRQFSASTAVPTLNRNNLRDTFVEVPPLDEQHEIVRRVEALFKIADQIEERYMKAKAYIDKLTQSILAKAFRGELVPQDPNDEPVPVLLKRIRHEGEKR